MRGFFPYLIACSSRNILEHLGFGQLIPEPSKAQEASLEEAEQSLDLLTLNGTENGHTEQHQEPEGDGMDFFDEGKQNNHSQNRYSPIQNF